MTVRSVVVVGAGLAGLACALACVQAGARVTMLETRTDAAHVAAHVDVVPNLMRDLARLGVAGAVVRRGFAYTGLAVVNEHGNAGFTLPTRHLAGASLPPAAGIAFDEPSEVLLAAVLQSGVALHRGCTVQAVRPEGGCAIADGGAVFEADLVVLAAGSDSDLVSALLEWRKPRATRHVSLHTLLPRPWGLDCATWVAGAPGRRMLLVPVSMSRAGVAVIGPEAPAEVTDAGVIAVQLQAWGSLPRRVAATIDPSAQAVSRAVHGTVCKAPWHRGAVLCVGAAAHSFPLPFGQSTAQSLEDAVVLGELVSAGMERQVLLQNFMARRGPRARLVHTLVERASRWMSHPEPATDLMQLAGDIAALVAQPA